MDLQSTFKLLVSWPSQEIAVCSRDTAFASEQAMPVYNLHGKHVGSLDWRTITPPPHNDTFPNKQRKPRPRFELQRPSAPLDKGVSIVVLRHHNRLGRCQLARESMMQQD